MIKGKLTWRAGTSKANNHHQEVHPGGIQVHFFRYCRAGSTSRNTGQNKQ
ncbi:MAG: hypothetical protein ACFFD4_39495 [Candidatus Odinarchaeota archaeon]